MKYSNQIKIIIKFESYSVLSIVKSSDRKINNIIKRIRYLITREKKIKHIYTLTEKQIKYLASMYTENSQFGDVTLFIRKLQEIVLPFSGVGGTKVSLKK